MRYTYSHWNGSQNHDPLDVDALIDTMSTDLLSDGGLDAALLNMITRGAHAGSLQLPGLRDLVRQLQRQRTAELERCDLDSTLTDIRDRLAAMIRGGSGRPIRLGLDDFEVFRTEQVGRSATVLMRERNAKVRQ